MENNIWTFGFNYYGELGLGDKMKRIVAEQISNLKAKQVSAGGCHTLVIDMKNNVWVFGYNDYGQLGIKGPTYIHTPTKIPDMKAMKAMKVIAGYKSTAIITII